TSTSLPFPASSPCRLSALCVSALSLFFIRSPSAPRRLPRLHRGHLFRIPNLPQRQPPKKRRPPSPLALKPDLPPMLLHDDRVRQRQPLPRPSAHFFGGEKQLKHPRPVPLRHTTPRILDLNLRPIVLPPRPYRDHPQR